MMQYVRKYRVVVTYWDGSQSWTDLTDRVEAEQLMKELEHMYRKNEVDVKLEDAEVLETVQELMIPYSTVMQMLDDRLERFQQRADEAQDRGDDSYARYCAAKKSGIIAMKIDMARWKEEQHE